MHDHVHDDQISVLGIIVTTIPFIGFVAVMMYMWGWESNLTGIILFVSLFVISGFGITVGYHRLFTHASFKTYPWVKFVFGVMGSMAVEGRIIDWVTDHRKHHEHSDKEGDPHSPVFNRDGWWPRIKGAFHAHLGWILIKGEPRDHEKYASGLLKDPIVTLVDRFFLLWVLLGILIPTLIGGLITMSWSGVLQGFLWGGLARISFVHHTTWSINSICHMFGAQPFESGDGSRNNVIISLVGLGENWHNNHHAFPYSARHGLKWWQIDVSWYLIKILERSHLVWDVRVPTQKQIERKMKSTPLNTH